MIDNISAGGQILLLRKRKGFTQEELADRLGITAQAISKWENGHALPETALLPLLAKLLDSTIDAILMPVTVKEGDIMSFGSYQWRVLQVNEGGALIITETTIGKAPFHDSHTGVTWEKCSLRKYLNGEFCDKFTDAEKSRIIKTKLSDRDNPWYGVSCGDPTFDRIFLLSYDEVIRYFGDSGDMRGKKGWFWAEEDKIAPADCTCRLKYGDCIFDQFNDARKVRSLRGDDDWWWLRSPGGYGMHTAGSIGYFGELFLCGDDACRVDGGVRPALWLSIQ